MALEKCTWTLASLVDPSVTGGGVDDDDERATTMPQPLTAAPVPLEAFKLVAGRRPLTDSPPKSPTNTRPHSSVHFQGLLPPTTDGVNHSHTHIR